MAGSCRPSCVSDSFLNESCMIAMAAVATAWPTKKQPVVTRLLRLSFIVLGSARLKKKKTEGCVSAFVCVL
jgi:hypothetical protein